MIVLAACFLHRPQHNGSMVIIWVVGRCRQPNKKTGCRVCFQTEDIQVDGLFLQNTGIFKVLFVNVYYCPSSLPPSSRDSLPLFGELQPRQANRVLDETAILPLAMEAGPGNGHVTQTRPIRTVSCNFFELELRKVFFRWQDREDVRLQFWGPPLERKPV